MKWLILVRLWLVWKLWPTRQSDITVAGNRTIYSFFVGEAEWMWTIRDLRQQDTHSREELIQMLRTVRLEEHRMQWKVPEPPPIFLPFKQRM